MQRKVHEPRAYHVTWYVCMVTHTARIRINRVRKVAIPARGQLNRENQYFFSLSAFAPENLVSQQGFGSPVPRQPAHLHTQAESVQ